MLVWWLKECPDRVAADLRRFYGVRLSDLYAGRESVFEVAHYVANYVRGGAQSEWLGGWGAVSAEDEGLRRLEFAVIAVNAERPPKPPKPPLAVKDEVAAARAGVEQALAWEQKYGGGAVPATWSDV